VTSLADAIAEEIHARGPMTIARFMELALYHPEFGYYTAGPPRAGWRGHFLTSAELDDAFGELWRRAFEDVWASCGRPSRFDVVEIGPGEGGFAWSVLDNVEGDFARALHYRLVEPSEPLRARQMVRLDGLPGTSWVTSIDELPRLQAGCIFANEVLDNQPVRLVENRESVIHEVLVDLDDGGFLTRTSPADSDLVAWLEDTGMNLPPGGRAEIGQAADRLVAAAADRLERGSLIVCDYGMTAIDAARRTGGTIACYSESGVDDNFLDAPGTKDITAHVNWTSVVRILEAAGLSVAGVLTQRTVLKNLGIDDVHNELRARAQGGGVDGVRALSRRQALGILTDPGGLGALGVIVATRAIALPTWASAGHAIGAGP
jgi:SAM-dependent MidA family methyltransferase